MIRAAIIRALLTVHVRPTSFREIRTPALRKKCADLYRAMRRMRRTFVRPPVARPSDFIPAWMLGAPPQRPAHLPPFSVFSARQAD